MPPILSRSVILLLLCGGVVPYLAQDNPSELDFLDKVENIKVPAKQEKSNSNTTTTTNNAKSTKEILKNLQNLALICRIQKNLRNQKILH
jgi:hypothetical protein